MGGTESTRTAKVQTAAPAPTPALRLPAEALREPDLPGVARLAIAREAGDPLDPTIARDLGPRLGLDLGGVRIHADREAASAAAELGARAFTYGPHVFFGARQYEPERRRGLDLLTHELTHVAQQATGSAGSVESDERQADAVARGQPAHFARVGEIRPRLRMEGTATSLAISVGVGGKGAMFTVVTSSGETFYASGSISGLAPGSYTVMAKGGAAMIIRDSAGAVVPATTRFDIPNATPNLKLSRALSKAFKPIPMTVAAGISPAQHGSGDATNVPDPYRAKFQELPQHIQDFLTTKEGDSKKEPNFELLLRIGKKIEHLTEAELAEFKARTGGKGDIYDLERSLEIFLETLQKRAEVDAEARDAQSDLFGLDAVYEMWRKWQSQMVSYPALINGWEAMDTASLPETHDGVMAQLYLKMRRSLQPHGFANLQAFGAAIERFVVAFRESTYQLGLELLDKFDHTLMMEGDRYNADTGSLYDSLAAARETFADAEQFQEAAKSQYGGMDPDSIHNYYAAGTIYQEKMKKGRSEVAAQSGAHPLLGAQDFPREEIGQASRGEVSQIIKSYIETHRTHVKNTRASIGKDNHEAVFKLDNLMAQSKARQGIEPNSIWDKILADHVAPTVDEMALQFALLTFTVALAIASGGSALAAVASFGLGAYAAYDEYERYATESDAYGAQLLSDEPELAWVVIAIAGAAADLGMVTATIKPNLAVLKAFQKGEIKTVQELEEKLVGVDANIRKAIVARAEIEVKARAGWKSLLPEGGNVAFSSLGVEQIAGPILYSVYINFERVRRSFVKWAATKEAVSLIGDFGKLSPEDLLKVKAYYTRYVSEIQKIVDAGARMRMSHAEVQQVIEAWAKTGGGKSADELIETMRMRTVEIDRTTSAEKVTRKSLPPNHQGGVRVKGPNGSYVELGPLDKQGRSTRVVAYVNKELLAKEIGAEASGKVVGRDASQDRGHLLARILGGPNLPHNLAPLIKNINSGKMRVFEGDVFDAIAAGDDAFIVVTPVYKEGRVDPEAFEMTVKYKSGKAEPPQRFVNPVPE